MNKLALGQLGERIAKTYLQQKGYTFLEQNLYTHWGELDLVFLHNSTLIFVEVRSRSRVPFQKMELPLLFPKRKIQRLRHTIGTLFERSSLFGNLFDTWRVDFIAVTFLEQKTTIAHMKGVFDEATWE